MFWSAFLSGIAVVILGFQIRTGSRERQILCAILLGAFAARAVIAVILQFSDWIPGKYYWDSVTYQWLVLRQVQGETLPDVSHWVLNHVWFLSRFFLLLGPVPLFLHLISRRSNRTNRDLGWSLINCVGCGLTVVASICLPQEIALVPED